MIAVRLGLGVVLAAAASWLANATISTSISAYVAQGGNPTNTFTTAASFSVASDDFESGGWSGGEGWLWGWSNSGSAAVTSAGGPYEGAYHLQLVSYDGYVDRALDLSGHSNVHLRFWAKVDSFETGDAVDCIVISDGTPYLVRSWTDADSDSTYHSVDIDLSPYAMSSVFYVSFDARMSATDDYFYIDGLVLRALPP